MRQTPVLVEFSEGFGCGSSMSTWQMGTFKVISLECGYDGVLRGRSKTPVVVQGGVGRTTNGSLTTQQ